MKKITILICLLFIFANCDLKSQNIVGLHKFDKIYIQKNYDFSYSELLKMKIIELANYSDAFLYYNELKENKYVVDSSSKEISILFTGVGKLKTSETTKKRIVYTKEKVNVNGAIYNALTLQGDETQFLNYDKIFAKLNGSPFNFEKSFSMVSNVWRSKILMDKEILNFSPIGYNNYGKILNKGATTQNLITSNNQPCQLFADASDGTVLTFLWDNQQIMAKVFCVDKLWNRVVWFDQNMSIPFSQSYGSYGTGMNQFSYPTGIVRSNYPVMIGQNCFDYSIYVADQGNNRIVKFIYEVFHNSQPAPYWSFYVKPNSFLVIHNASSPFDIELHPGVNNNTESDDILWYTSSNSGSTSLRSINTSNGQILNEINQYYYNGQIYPLNAHRISVYKSPDGQKNVLACIDRNENALLFFKLEQNGTMSSNIPVSNSVYKYSNSHSLTSVKLLSTNPALGLNAYVSSDNINGNISVFKVNLIGSIPIADYIASYWKGNNSDLSFYRLNNLATQDGFIDIFTTENWDNTYGIRRYKPSLDTVYTNIPEYCSDLKTIKLKIRVTNDCFFRDRIDYFDGNNWHYLLPHNISGLSMLQGYFVLTAGTNEFTLTGIQMPNSTDKGYAKKISLSYELSPIDEGIYSSNKITKEFGNLPWIECNSIGGGCPFIYVFDGNNQIQDNNILHRSEFQDFKGVDITDKYKLNTIPYFNPIDSICNLTIKELNSDISNIDKIQLKAVDHPAGTLVGITENKDVVLYFPQNIINPTNGTQNNNNVTCNLQYDSLCIPITGDSSDVITTSANLGDNFKSRFLRYRNQIEKIFGNPISFSKALNGDNSVDNILQDSMAVIFDGFHLSENGNVNKEYAGSISAYNNDLLYSSGEKKFTQRENISVTIVPVGKDVFIDSININWNRDYNISYLCATPIYYEGFIESNCELAFADNTLQGDIKELLVNVDNNYANLDNQGDINLYFKNSQAEIPEGWIRDYIITIEGRYEKMEGKRLSNKSANNSTIPKEFKLYQNYPNPFNPISNIKYDVPKDTRVKIVIYDLVGREIKTLVNEVKEAGSYNVQFNGSNLASGVYFYRIQAGDYIMTKRMVLIK